MTAPSTNPGIDPDVDPGPRTALIVGGASGIGLATAQLLGGLGYALGLFDRDKAALEEAGEELRAAGADVHVFVGDVTDSRTLTEAVTALEASPGNLRVLVNTVGILHLGTIDQLDEADWDQLLEINLKGVYLACKATIPALTRAGGGAIVNLTSQSGRTKSYFSAPDYVASKAGIIGLTMALANQNAEFGIRVNCVAPGLAETPMLSVYTAKQRESMLASIPLGRFATPDEIAEAVVFLATSKSSYITGQTLNVNGGSFML